MVCDQGGKVIFSRMYNREEGRRKEEFKGGFISALMSFSESCINDVATQFDLESHKISFIKEDCFIFAITTPKKVSEGLVKEILKSISKKFFETYRERIIDRFKESGECEVFERELYEERIENDLKPINQFWNSLS